LGKAEMRWTGSSLSLVLSENPKNPTLQWPIKKVTKDIHATFLYGELIGTFD